MDLQADQAVKLNEMQAKLDSQSKAVDEETKNTIDE